MRLFTKICELVISLHTKNFFIQISNCTMKVCLELYESFASKILLKFNCLIDFLSPVCLPCVHICMHIVVRC